MSLAFGLLPACVPRMCCRTCRVPFLFCTHATPFIYYLHLNLPSPYSCHLPVLPPYFPMPLYIPVCCYLYALTGSTLLPYLVVVILFVLVLPLCPYTFVCCLYPFCVVCCSPLDMYLLLLFYLWTALPLYCIFVPFVCIFYLQVLYSLCLPATHSIC